MTVMTAPHASSWLGWLVALALPLAACDRDQADAPAPLQLDPDVDVQAERAPAAGNAVGVLAKEQLDLKAIAFLVEKAMVKDAKALEAELNKDGKGYHTVDLDGDGARDRIAVVEVREGGKRRFELKIVPSSAKPAERADAAVTVAFIDVAPDTGAAEVDVTVRYTDVVIHEPGDDLRFVVALTVDGLNFVVEDNVFLAWVLILDRPLYVSVEIVIDVHVHRHHKHKKHKKHKKHRRRW